MPLVDGIFKLVSRAERKARGQLGVINLSDRKVRYESLKCRSAQLDLLDAYYDLKQYDHLPNWDSCGQQGSDYTPVRSRRPRLNYAFAKTLCKRIGAKLVGDKQFPTFTIADDPDTEAYLNMIQKASNLKAFLIDPMRRMLSSGSVFVRFYISANGQFVMQKYLSKYCYPIFNDGGDLLSVTIRYVYEDLEQVDESGKPKQLWYQMTLGQHADVLYDNPEYHPEAQEIPEFQEVNRVEHGLGFVQGEWFKTIPDQGADGYSLYEDILDFIDEVNYNLSQSSQAVGYNQDPQLAINGMDEEELGELIRSSQKGWNLGKDGKAQFVESGLNGVKAASELRDKVILGIQHVARVAFHDPDKMNMNAVSGKALEIMNAPLVEVVEELRPVIGPCIQRLISKMAIANLEMGSRGMEVPVLVPNGYAPQSFDVETTWPPVFQNTMVDLQQKMTVANIAATGNIISRESVTRWVAADFGVKDVEEELQKIAAQPIINPFGAF